MPELHHIALGALDPAKLASFYHEIFDLQEIARHTDEHGKLRSVWLKIGSAVLMLERTQSQAPYVDGIGKGPFLLALEVSAPERPSFERRLEAAGHPIEARTDYTSYTRDPEGNRIAISHYPIA